MSDSCEASVKKAEATASVIMAKKMARTRKENKPTPSASTKESANEHSKPTPIASQVGPKRVAATAMP